MKIYLYEKCDTCRKALKFLEDRDASFETIPIRQQPPTVAELKRMLGYVGDMKRLFNTSGLDYKAMTRMPLKSVGGLHSVLLNQAYSTT